MRYYVTTGKSLSTHARCWIGVRDERYDLQSRERLYETSGGRNYLNNSSLAVLKLFETMGQDEDYFEECSQAAIGGSFEVGCWSDALGHLLPAELSTLRLMDAGPPLPQADNQPHEVIFLIGKHLHDDGELSNAREGFLCWAMFKKLVEEGHTKQFQNAKVTFTPNLDWNPSAPDRLRQTIVDLVDKELKAPFDLVLTGGYKGMLIGLTIRAVLKMKTTGWSEKRDAELGDKQWQPKAYYLSEGSKECVCLPLYEYLNVSE